MKKVGAFEAKTHFSQLLSEVEHTGRKIIIQRRGKDVAMLGPCEQAATGTDEEEAERILRVFEEIRARQKPLEKGERAKDFVEEGRER